MKEFEYTADPIRGVPVKGTIKGRNVLVATREIRWKYSPNRLINLKVKEMVA